MLVVICGYPRSGTSYLHKLFANYAPKIYATQKEDKDDSIWSTNEPIVFGSYIGDYNCLIEPYVCFHKALGRNDVVYKHPQAVLFAPFDDRFDVRYIVCHRKKDNWLKGALNYEPTIASVAVDTNVLWIKRFWKGEWVNPVDISQRLFNLHDIFTENIELLKNSNKIIFDFDYHNPKVSLELILNEFEFEISLEDALALWSPKYDK